MEDYTQHSQQPTLFHPCGAIQCQCTGHMTQKQEQPPSSEHSDTLSAAKDGPDGRRNERFLLQFLHVLNIAHSG